MANTPETPAAITSDTISCGFLPNIVCETIEILLKSGNIISVHKNVLLQCTFFANALMPEWIAAREGKPIDLSDVESEFFAAYVQWLYTHHVHVSFDTTKQAGAELYVLGERLMDLEFQDAIMSAMIARCEIDWPSNIEVCIIYEGTTAASPARRLMVDIFCREGDEDWIDSEDGDKLPIDFHRDLARALMKKPDLPDRNRPWNVDRSAYYVGVGKKA
ncbi:hypothetical protein BKA63DRAFT_559873 [Paraphoma chrysanthemicola]|nr:hypothetical protein BKA63DRAFT_559873 [Paraphoma chrysanthemicola]